MKFTECEFVFKLFLCVKPKADRTFAPSLSIPFELVGVWYRIFRYKSILKNPKVLACVIWPCETDGYRAMKYAQTKRDRKTTLRAYAINQFEKFHGIVLAKISRLRALFGRRSFCSNSWLVHYSQFDFFFHFRQFFEGLPTCLFWINRNYS